MPTYLSAGPAETEAVGESLGRTLCAGQVVAYRGGLGAGKTCFTRGLARGLGYPGDDVISPTFALVNEYHGGRLPLYHFDMYRVTTPDDLYSTGFFDYLDDDAVLAIEWSENIADALPDDTLFVDIEPLSDGRRRITISGGEAHEPAGA